MQPSTLSSKPEKDEQDNLEKKYTGSLGQDDVERGTQEAEDFANQGSLYSASSNKPKARNWLRKHRRKLGAGGVLGTLLFAYSIFIGSGPLQILNWSKLLEEFHFSGIQEMSDQRAGRAIHNWRWKNARQDGRLNIVTRKWAEKLDGKFDRKTGVRTAPGRLETELGIRGIYDKSSGRGTGFEITDVDKASQRIDFDELKRNGISVDLERKIIEIPRSFFSKEGRFATKFLLETSGLSKKAAYIAARPLSARLGWSFHPLGRIKRLEGETLSGYLKRLKEDYRKQIKEGDFKLTADAKGAGDNPDQTAEDAARAREDIAKNFDATLTTEAPDGTARVNEIKAKITSGIRGKIGVIGVVSALVCAIRGVGDAAEDLDYFQIVQPLARVGGRIISLGGQLMSGQGFSAEEIGEDINRLYDEANKTNFGDAVSIQAEMGKPQTGDKSTGKKLAPGAHDNFVKATIGSIPGLSAACTVVGSFLGGLVIDIVDFGLDVASLATNFVAGMGIGEAVSPLLDWIAETLAGEEVNIDAQGAILGEYANYGARIAANNQAIIMGGRQLSAAEGTQLATYFKSKQQEQFATNSLWHKLFAKNDPHSVAGQVTLTAPRTVSQAAAAIQLDSFSGLFSGFGKWFSSVISGAHAASGFDYNGYPEVGYSLEEMGNPQFENPLENADIIEPKLFEKWLGSDNKIHNPLSTDPEYKKCSGVTLLPDGSIEFGTPSRYPLPKECRTKATDTLYARYRFYLADLITNTSLACNEGDQDSCDNLGLEDTGTATSPDGETVSGDIQQLAKAILKNPKIIYETSSEGITPRDVMLAISKGKPAYTTCSNAANTTTDLNPSILKFILAAGQKTNIQVNALTDKCHSDGSNHYSGEAVDIDLQSSGSLSILTPIATKYGGTKNYETSHHHFDFPKE